MSDYNQLKNAAILTPTTGTDLGSDTNRYSNVFMTGNIAMSNGVIINSTNAITPRIASITYSGNITAASAAGGETITITGSGFSNSGGNPSVIIGTSSAPVVTYISSTSITFTSPAKNSGTYALYVINVDGGTAIYGRGISYSGSPNWTTASGTIGTGSSAASVSFTVTATSDSAVIYSVTSGSLPNGLSLDSSTGAITGTMPTFANATTFNFTITATDAENQTTSRAFSINGSVAPSSIQYIIIAGGGSGGGQDSAYYGGGGGGAGGYISSITGESSGGGESAVSPISVSGGDTFNITVGAGGTPAAGLAESQGNDGGFSAISGTSIATITAVGGGGGGGDSIGSRAGGSGGGGGDSRGSPTAGQGYIGGTSFVNWTNFGGGGGGGAGGVGGNNMSPSPFGGVGVKTGIFTSFTGTASIASSTTLTITAVSAGEIQVGTQVTGTGIPAGSYIIALGTGTGSTGTYIMNAAATATSTDVAITSTGRFHAGGGSGSPGLASHGIGGAGGGGGGGPAVNGAPNTGGGGSYYMSSGGSGLVIIRYSNSFGPAASTTGSPTYTVENGHNIYKFTQSGTITF